MTGRIIHDIEGNTLRLTKTTLVEVKGYNIGPFYLRLHSLQNRPLNGNIYSTAAGRRIAEPMKPVPRASITINYTQRRIGCKTFSKSVFAQILKAADAL
jgi:hypothetical protein